MIPSCREHARDLHASLNETREVGLEQQFERGGRAHGLREEVALPEVAAEVAQLRELRDSLDALGYDVHAEAARERDDGTDYLRVLSVVRHLRDERAVNLQCVNREAV